MPVYGEVRLPLLSTSCKVNLGQFSAINDFAVYRQFLFKNTEFPEILWVFKSDGVSIGLIIQLNLNFESSGRIPMPTGQVLGFDQFSDPVGASRDLLKNFQCEANRRLACAVLTDQQDRGTARDWQLEILQASEIMNIQSVDHSIIVHERSPICLRNN